MRRPQSKNEGEPLHIVSPSTIPLTLGEEMAVLVLPGELYQSDQATCQRRRDCEVWCYKTQNRADSLLGSKHCDEKYRDCRGSNAGDASRLAYRAWANVAEFLNYLVGQA